MKYINNKIIENTVLLILFVLAGIGTYLLLDKTFTANEMVECIAWQAQAEQYPDWYATDWQIDQCNYVGVPLIVE